MTGVEVVTASAGDEDVVLDILRSASTAGRGNRASTATSGPPGNKPPVFVVAPTGRAARLRHPGHPGRPEIVCPPG